MALGEALPGDASASLKTPPKRLRECGGPGRAREGHRAGAKPPGASGTSWTAASVWEAPCDSVVTLKSSISYCAITTSEHHICLVGHRRPSLLRNNWATTSERSTSNHTIRASAILIQNQATKAWSVTELFKPHGDMHEPLHMAQTEILNK